MSYQYSHALLVMGTITCIWFLFVFSCVYVRLDFYLKRKVKKPAWMGIFPSLEKMHTYVIRLFYASFVCLTVLMINGIIYAHGHWDEQNWLTQPKLIASVLTWVYFFVMMIIRIRKGLRGVVFFVWLIIGCLLIALSMYSAYAW